MHLFFFKETVISSRWLVASSGGSFVILLLSITVSMTFRRC